MYKFILFIVLMVTASSNVSAAVYTCTVDGVTQYSQMPCGDGAPEKVTSLETIAPPIKSEQYSKSSSAKGNGYLVKAHIINNKIKRSEANIKAYQKKMVKEIKILKARTYNANNNLAGAVYQNALSREMVAVTNKYNTLIENEKISINKQKTLLSGLGNQ